MRSPSTFPCLEWLPLIYLSATNATTVALDIREHTPLGVIWAQRWLEIAFGGQLGGAGNTDFSSKCSVSWVHSVIPWEWLKEASWFSLVPTWANGNWGIFQPELALRPDNRLVNGSQAAMSVVGLNRESSVLKNHKFLKIDMPVCTC